MTMTLEEWVQQHLAEFDEQYVALHGQPPLAECFEWAQAIERWQAQHPDLLGNFGPIDPDIDRGLLTTAIAECLHLAMVRTKTILGDLDLEHIRWELWRWISPGTEHPAPGSVHWPAPSAPFAAPWRALMLEQAADERWRVVKAATEALAVLTNTVAQLPPALHDYRLREAGLTYVALAQAAPVVGIAGAVAVSNPRFFEGLEGLTVVKATQPS
ncbi:hypothetical protein QQY66_34395 [Streptomyces sp. DG2A-72]|uniref:hypothetical protein n=1 Tax=Streptomyces sp. DG2A-72 TaxID=3051386 RepID=UPI00265C8271|nr:hypothetical protein [Streptomyces sp. DG2A-72]MDO0936552.1 hypothetical protein [Streptomyces sp. DG2A-72]